LITDQKIDRILNKRTEEVIKVSTFFMETHTHLDLIKRNAQEVVKDAAEKKVTKMVAIGIDLESSKIALEFASLFEGVYASIGFHPHESKFLDEGWPLARQAWIIIGTIVLYLVRWRPLRNR